MRSPGRMLDPATRAFMDARFGHDFGRVRIHADTKAAQAANALSADAFTVGNDVFFASGLYAPHTGSGRELLAHELVHTLQQQGAVTKEPLAIDARPEPEAEAERAARTLTQQPTTRLTGRFAATPAAIQRKMTVNKPADVPVGAPPAETNAKIVDGYVTSLCSDFTVTGGDVVPKSAAACAGPSATTPESCGCFCTMHTLKDPKTGNDIVWTIDVNDKDWPHTDSATKTVTVHSPFSGVQFGAWAKGPPAHRMTYANWLVLGHEMCGHAQLLAKGTHPVGPAPTHGGRPSHDATVAIENKIAKEHGIPAGELRGLFADPHHGESFARVTVSGFPTGSADVAALPPAEARQLDIAEAFIKSAPVSMDVIGHSDQEGPISTNAVVSRKRADSVRTSLEARGIGARRFVATRGVGSTECPTPGDQSDCRKVEVFMFINMGASVTHP